MEGTLPGPPQPQPQQPPQQAPPQQHAMAQRANSASSGMSGVSNGGGGGRRGGAPPGGQGNGGPQGQRRSNGPSPSPQQQQHMAQVRWKVRSSGDANPDTSVYDGARLVRTWRRHLRPFRLIIEAALWPPAVPQHRWRFVSQPS